MDVLERYSIRLAENAVASCNEPIFSKIKQSNKTTIVGVQDMLISFKVLIDHTFEFLVVITNSLFVLKGTWPKTR